MSEPEQTGDAMRAHADDPSEGAPVNDEARNADAGDQADVPREHPEEPAEG